MTQNSQNAQHDTKTLPQSLLILKGCSQRVEAMAYSLVGKATAHDLAELIRIAATIEGEISAIGATVTQDF